MELLTKEDTLSGIDWMLNGLLTATVRLAHSFRETTGVTTGVSGPGEATGLRIMQPVDTAVNRATLRLPYSLSWS